MSHSVRTGSSVLMVAMVFFGLMACSGDSEAECPAQLPPQGAFEQADWVVVGTLSQIDDGTFQGRPAHRYRLNNAGAPILKGEDVLVRRLPVTSTPDLCGDMGYPDGDPLAQDGHVILFLVKEADGSWRTLDYAHAAIPVPDADVTELPDAWPEVES